MAAATILDRLRDAQNAHDVDAMLDCLHPDYRSEQPRHPGRAFRGTDQVRKNWTRVFAAFPDLTVELVRWTAADDGQTVWSEWRWAGTPDGSGFEMLGVIIFGIREDRIAWARLYMDEVERADETIDEAVATSTREA